MRSRLCILPLAAGSTLLLAAACGGQAPAPAAPAPAASAAAPVTIPASWSDDMTKEQKVAFMKKNVLPTMGPVFQAHDVSRYASFSCKTCHGPSFKDPHEFLPKLTLKDGKLTAFADKPEVAKFMAESVEPKMAAAMGLPPYDPATQQGFGCHGCHEVEKK